MEPLRVDVGYFGPGSLTWRIHGEPVAMLGGLRALLLQALHPGAMRLLYSRSNFEDDPWGRLARTSKYVATVSFAPTDEVDAASAVVRDVHERLGIVDPEQLAWVHACLVDSFLVAAEASGLRLTPAEQDRYVREQMRAADLVAVPPDLVPVDVAGLRAVMSSIRPRLTGTDEARAAARTVVLPPISLRRPFTLPARLGWTAVSGLAVGMLPAWARRLYGLPPLPGATLTTTASLRLLRTAVRALPAQYRQGPLYREAQARAAAVV